MSLLSKVEEYERPLVEKYRPVTLEDVVGNVYTTNSGSTLTLGSGAHTFQFANSDNSFVNNTFSYFKNWYCWLW